MPTCLLYTSRGKKGASVAAMFFSQFKDLMILILAAATLISVLMGEGTAAITIIIIVLLNATMGFLQEYRTEKTLEALKELSAPTARVRRSGREPVSYTHLDVYKRQEPARRAVRNAQ